jgi:hypothetical protein
MAFPVISEAAVAVPPPARITAAIPQTVSDVQARFSIPTPIVRENSRFSALQRTSRICCFG